MKKLMTLMLGMALAFGTVAVSYAQAQGDSGSTKNEGKKKKKGGKKKGSDTTETPKGSR